MNSITAETLHQSGACDDAVEQFAREHPKGIRVPTSPKEQIELLLSSEVARRGWGWAVRHKIVPAWSMAGMSFKGADLRKADLRGADLQEANLQEADLRGANLRGANLRWADLRGADLRGADLWEADLRESDLREANTGGILGVPETDV